MGKWDPFNGQRGYVVMPGTPPMRASSENTDDDAEPEFF